MSAQPAGAADAPAHSRRSPERGRGPRDRGEHGEAEPGEIRDEQEPGDEERPLLGVGANMYRTVNTLGKEAHNSFVSVLVELGLPLGELLALGRDANAALERVAALHDAIGRVIRRPALDGGASATGVPTSSLPSSICHQCHTGSDQGAQKSASGPT